MVALLANSVKQKVLLIRGIQFSAVSYQKESGFGDPSYKRESVSKGWHEVEIEAFVIND